MRTWMIGLCFVFWGCGDNAADSNDDVGEMTDSAATDTGQPDTAATDTSQPDTVATDTSQPDTVATDTSEPDTGAGDTNPTDTAATDTGTADTTQPDTADTAGDTTQADTTPEDVASGCPELQLDCGGICMEPATMTVANDVATTSSVTGTGFLRQGVKNAPAGLHRYASVRVWLDAAVGTAHVELATPAGPVKSNSIEVTSTGWQEFVFSPPVRPSLNIQFPNETTSVFTLRFVGQRTVPTTLNAYPGATANLDVGRADGSALADTSNDLRFSIVFEGCP